MNSNYRILLLLFLFLASSCGVKSDPIPPNDSSYSSYDTKFTQKTKPKPTPTAAPINE